MLSFYRLGCCDTPKLNVYVFITMQAEDIHIHTRNIDGFVETTKVSFLDQAHVFRQKASQNDEN